MQRKSPLIIDDLRGGRNGTDPPASLPDTQCIDALNVDWYDGLLGRKRGGSDSVALTGGTAFTLIMQSLIRHVPGAAETAAELWGIDGAATPIVKRLTGSTTWADVTLSDAIASGTTEVYGATLNSKLYLAYDSTVDRLHAYDALLGSPRVRRVGFATPAAPTAANTGAGSYAAVLRYYRVRWLQLSGTTVIRRSEPGASVSFTPSGSGTAARVTQPAVASEQETHWEVEASTDDSAFYRLSQVAIATTTYDDSAATTTYSSNTASDVAGYHTNWTSVKYLMTDGNRLLGAGAWETSGARNSRVWFSPVLGSADKGDDERVRNTTTQKDYVDLNENDGGYITGFGGPLNGNVIVFKYRQTWKLVATGDVATPYLPRRLSDAIGTVSQKSVCLAEDEAGRPALYWLSHKGPYRLGSGGLQYLGRDNEDIWSTLNLGATSSIVGHTVYHSDKHQVWFHVATGSNNDADTRMVFDTLLGQVDEHNRVRGGWSRHTGNAAGARCSVMFSNTLGASMSRDLKPHIGRSTGTTILKCDTATTDDAGTAFQAYVETKPLPLAPLGVNVGIGQTHLLAEAAASVTITQTITRDYGLETLTATASLTAAGNETRVLRKIEGSDLSQCGTIQIRLGDGSALASAWTLDAMAIPFAVEDPR